MKNYKKLPLNYYLLFFIIILFFSCTSNEQKINTEIAYVTIGNNTYALSEVVDSLQVPWDIDAKIADKLWFTEQNGSVYTYNLKSNKQKKVLQIHDVLYKKSYGLLGMAVDPDESHVYLHYTYAAASKNSKQVVKSRVVRYSYQNDSLINKQILLDSIPGNTYHNGSRLLISPDKKLFISLGDVGNTKATQTDTVITGKILRINLDGSIPIDNPIQENPVWSKGHRNAQGLTWGKNNILYSSEHGPNTNDEINLIYPNNNYGWPDVHGYCDTGNEKLFCKNNPITEPIKAWTPTIAPAGIVYFNHKSIPHWQNSILVANLKGRALRVLKLNEDGNQVIDESIYFQKIFGRIRDVDVAPDGSIYFCTSNTDWHPRFQPWMYDSLPSIPDRIIRLKPIQKENINAELPVYKKDKKSIKLQDENWAPTLDEEFKAGTLLYSQHCLACHGPKGTGSPDLIPPLSKTDWVTGDKGRLIRLMLSGLSKPIEVNGVTYNQEMPSYIHLSDQEIADVLTYIRQSFGNDTSGVIPGEVYEERATYTRNN